jgi:hypothetical protein
MQHKGFRAIKDMSVCSRDHGWIIDPGKEEKNASYGSRFRFRIQLYFINGEICEGLYGRTLGQFIKAAPDKISVPGYDRLHQYFR